jgi:hypothetical protein
VIPRRHVREDLRHLLFTFEQGFFFLAERRSGTYLKEQNSKKAKIK